MSTLISITTYLKNEAARVLIKSLIEHGYTEGNKIILCDDSNNHHAREVFNEFRGKCKIAYSAGINGGIALNKNRGLKYFLTKTHFKNTLLIDDDIRLLRPGLIDHIQLACDTFGYQQGGKNIRLPFMTGYWTDHDALKEENVKGVTGNGWYKDFPVKEGTELVTCHAGSQGALMYLERSAVEKVGFFNTSFPRKYGYEHSIYFSRLLRSHSLCPEQFPVLRFCERFFCGQNIPNDYGVDRDSLFGYYIDPAGDRIEKNIADEQGIETTYVPGEQSKHHNKLLTECYLGYNLYVKESGLKKSKEILVEG